MAVTIPILRGDAAGDPGGDKVTPISREDSDSLREALERYEAAAADFEDAKARMKREQERNAARERAALLCSMLGLLDDLERALAAGGNEPQDPVIEGVELVRRRFVAKLSELGVEEIPAGQAFDANLHEAVATVAVQDPAARGKILEVVKKGYTLAGMLLRPASVVVGR